MKKKGIIIIAIILLALLGYGVFQYCSQPDGSTLESREEILKDTPKGIAWNIAQEQDVNGYLLSGIYSNSKSGIAVFEPIGDDKYRLVSSGWGDADDIVISEFISNDEWYDVIWFNGAETSYAEIIYSVNGKENEPIVFDTSNMKIICTKSPHKDYILHVKYYDNGGNIYENEWNIAVANEYSAKKTSKVIR